MPRFNDFLAEAEKRIVSLAKEERWQDVDIYIELETRGKFPSLIVRIPTWDRRKDKPKKKIGIKKLVYKRPRQTSRVKS